MKKARALNWGCSAVAVISFGLAQQAHAQVAQPPVEPAPIPPATQPAEPDSPATNVTEGPSEAATNTIIVTGTSIRGVAPVGSSLVVAGQEQIEQIAATNIAELTNTIPAITAAGSAPQAENVYSGFAPSIHGIGGSSSNSTLVIMDGLRMVGGGTQYMHPDPNTIPTPALERVEVITDGASAVYGSDAVSGVINYITRRTFDGAQVNGRIGFGDDYRNYDASAILGTEWDSGGAYIAGQFTKQSEVANIDRPFTVRGDYRDVGGSNTQGFNCLPATIRTPATGTGQLYPSPSATETIANNASENGFCNNAIYGAGIPASERSSVLASFYQELGERFSLHTKVNYGVVSLSSDDTPGTGNATVFGPGSGREGQINPFFMAPAGEPGATQETVTYVVLRPDGDYGRNEQESETFYTTSVFEAELFGEWTGTISGALGRTNNTRNSYGSYCSVCATLALNATTFANGVLGQSSVPNQNLVVDNLPLTTGNALDVWNPVGSSRTSQSVLDYIYSNDDLLTHKIGLEQLQAVTQGPLFALPAGELRVAVGGELLWLRQRITDVNPGTAGNSSVSVNVTDFTLRRDVKSAFSEVFIPLVSPDMEIPVVESFDIRAALRHDSYSDFGSTTNPMFAANWGIIPGLSLRANWGKSFVAPAMLQVGDPSRGYARGASGAGIAGAFDVPLDLYPDARLLPGCVGATVTCRIGTGTNPGLTRSLGAGENTRPQRGKTWAVGLDIGPELIPNFRAAVTYWNTEFTGATSLPALELILGSGALRDRLQICPTGCTQAQIDEFTQINNGAPFNAVLPPTTYFLVNRNLENLLNFDVAGIDAQADYSIHTDSIGTFTLGGSVTYFTKYDQWFFDAPRFSILNTSGFNSQFPSIQTRGRISLLWDDLGGFEAAAFMHFTGPYNNWISSTVEPLTFDENGNPSGGGDRVEGEQIFDLNFAYEGESGFMEGHRVYLNIKNVFDTEPAYFNGNTSGIGVGAWGYNAFVSNPIGRIVSVGFSTNF